MDNEATVQEPVDIGEAQEMTEPPEATDAHDDGNTDIDGSESELETLRRQVSELTDELRARKQEAERISAQLEEFSSFFPDVGVNTVPDSVWDSVRSGNSLAAAYALYARKIQMRDEQIKAINSKNASLSTGKAGRGTASEYLTPDEVRAMSRGEVRANYSKIIEFMKKWN